MAPRIITPPDPTIVAISRSDRAGYGELPTSASAPELSSGAIRTVGQLAVRRLFEIWGLDALRLGSGDWNPLGTWIRPGDRVVVKPNWVLHRNKGGGGMDCLVTHSSVIEAVLEYVALARPGEVILGDAPIQGCDFDLLERRCGISGLLKKFKALGMTVSVRDFRRTVSLGHRIGAMKLEERRPLRDYVLFDLGKQSLLEPLAAHADRFRVTMYNPDLLQRTHAQGKHQYLIAREVMEAAVVLNLPKLKCHQKAGVTGALKNMVGINGNKEYLPHHRRGSPEEGGDCYARRSRLKGLAEDLLDAANRRGRGKVQLLLGRSAQKLLGVARLLGHDANLEGSWYGNDTVWRMCLDLQRILRYGRPDGTMASTPQRQVVSITDAIVGGEGDGPLSPAPVACGFLTGAANPAAADWVHALLMGFEPARIPLIRNAFGEFRYRLVEFSPEAIRVRTAAGEQSTATLTPAAGRSFLASSGWRGHCELT